MDSPEMDAPASMAKTEDLVSAFVEYLVNPLLPTYMVDKAPSIDKQQAVAKQMYAVVLLYNYYQRKLYPESEFLNVESFCDLVTTLKPSLKPHMKVMDRPDNKEPDDLENELSLTKKAIIDACNVSLVLDASKDSPCTEKWPISKVAVLLIDSSKENCFMQFGSITKGVWSVIEKDVDISNTGLESKEVGKHIRKKKRITKKTSSEEKDADETRFLELAFSAVKEAAGLDRDHLMLMESHTTYSLSKEKTATRFFIVQWTESKSFERQCRFPLKDAIESMEGPLLKTIAGHWFASAVVEHFNALPYAGFMSDWFSRKVLSKSLQDPSSGLEDANSSQRAVNTSHKQVSESQQLFFNSTQNSEVGLVNGSQKIDNPCGKEVTKSMGKSDEIVCITESTGNREKLTGNRESDRISGFSDSCGLSGGSNKSSKRKGDNGCHMIGLFNSSSGPHYTDIDETSVACPNKDRKSKIKKRKTCLTESDINPLTSSAKAQVTDSTMSSTNTECRGEKIDNGKKTSITKNSSDKDETPTGDPALAPFWLNTKYAEKIQVTPATKDGASRDGNGSGKNGRPEPESNPAEVTETVVKSTITKSSDEKVDIGNKTQENVDNGNKTQGTALSDQGGKPIGDQPAIHLQLNKEYLEKLQLTLAAKENELSQAAVGVLLKKQEKLCHQSRNLEDEIAVCYKNIQTILAGGGGDNIALKIEAIIESCKDVCLQGKTQSQDRIYQLVKEQCNSCQYAKGKRLSEAILTPRNPSLELDDICNQNSWALPKYRVSPSDDGFVAEVTVKGVDFECTNGSQSCTSPLEARDSAASRMIAKLRIMASLFT